MNANFEDILEKVHNRNKIIWFAVFFGMLLLVGLCYILYQTNLIDPLPVVNPADSDRFSLIIIVILTLSVFFIKRSFLIPSKMLEKANSGYNTIETSLTQLVDEQDERSLKLSRAASLANRYMMLVWFLADLIVLVAFINFILAPVLNTFLIYSLVAFYSLFINYPSKRIFKNLYAIIYG